MLHNLGGDLLENKLRHLVTSIPYEEGMFQEFPPGALVLLDWRKAESIPDATIRATKDGSFKRISMLLILNGNALASRETLLKIILPP